MNPRLFIAVAVVMGLIALVDYLLGATAEYLNAYELLRRTLAPGLPQVSERYVIGQQPLGRSALLVGWLLWFVEALLVERLLTSICWLATRAVHAL